MTPCWEIILVGAESRRHFRELRFWRIPLEPIPAEEGGQAHRGIVRGAQDRPCVVGLLEHGGTFGRPRARRKSLSRNCVRLFQARLRHGTSALRRWQRTGFAGSREKNARDARLRGPGCSANDLQGYLDRQQEASRVANMRNMECRRG